MLTNKVINITIIFTVTIIETWRTCAIIIYNFITNGFYMQYNNGNSPMIISSKNETIKNNHFHL